MRPILTTSENGFVVFFVMLFAVLAVLKLWAEIVHLLR